MMVAESQGVALAARCEDALQAAMQSLEQTAPGRWTAHFRNCGAPPLMAQLTDGLLVLSGAVSPANSRSRWDLVKVNEALPGLVKFCLAPDGELSLRAEIPIEEETDLRRRLAQVGRGFAAALRPRRNEHRVAVPPEAVAPDLPKLVEASGWPCSSRRGDSCAVPLETRHAGQTALITAPAGAVQVCTELTSWDTLSANCREAVAVLLLTANARLRLARSIITEDELGARLNWKCCMRRRFARRNCGRPWKRSRWAPTCARRPPRACSTRQRPNSFSPCGVAPAVARITNKQLKGSHDTTIIRFQRHGYRPDRSDG